MTVFKSLVPTSSLQTDDDDEGISEDQIFSTYKEVFERPPRQSSILPSIGSSFEECEDPLPKSSFVPIYDEPVFDEYDDDDMFFEVLDKPLYDDDQSEPDVQQELFTPSVHNKATNLIVISDKKIAIQDLSNGLDIEASIYFSRMLKETQMLSNNLTITKGPSTWAKLEMSKIGRQIDIGWIYPDRFSQPNPPP
ncbi:hypothetical protein M5K25_025133 [Dendrobium thyrsiflorum]|uniref:Uncharacterized protein n=1 Tax=Dendrobium thyrsiflorum TaxID=117978 RepID=A0ABD0U8D2_DENTH